MKDLLVEVADITAQLIMVVILIIVVSTVSPVILVIVWGLGAMVLGVGFLMFRRNFRYGDWSSTTDVTIAMVAGTWPIMTIPLAGAVTKSILTGKRLVF